MGQQSERQKSGISFINHKLFGTFSNTFTFASINLLHCYCTTCSSIWLPAPLSASVLHQAPGAFAAMHHVDPVRRRAQRGRVSLRRRPGLRQPRHRHRQGPRRHREPGRQEQHAKLHHRPEQVDCVSSSARWECQFKKRKLLRAGFLTDGSSHTCSSIKRRKVFNDWVTKVGIHKRGGVWKLIFSVCV